MRTHVLVLLLLLLVATFTCANRTNSTLRFEKCLWSCKQKLDAGKYPTSCFSNCRRSTLLSKKQPRFCSIPILDLGCKKQNYTRPEPRDEVMTDNDVNTAMIWQKYRDALISFLSQGTNKASSTSFSGLKLVSIPLPAEWDQNPEQLQAIVNQRQNWNPDFEMNMGAQGTFDSNYCDFAYDLNAVNTLSPSQDAAVKANSQQQRTLIRQLLEEEGKCEDAWFALPAVIRGGSIYKGDYSIYMKRRCLDMIDLQEQLKSLRGEMEQLYRSASGGQKEVLAREAVLKCANTANNRKFLELTKLSTFTSNVQAGKLNGFTFDLSTRSSYMKRESSYSSFGLNLFVIAVNSAKQKMQLTTKAEELNIKISAKSFTAIQVTPDPAWFEGDTIGAWKNGPFRSGKGSSAYFGPGGAISLMPRTLYVVYQPTIEVTLNAQDASEFKKQSSFSISLNIPIYYGVLNFGFGKKSSVHETKESGNMVRFRIENTSDMPQVIAINNVIL